MSNLILRPWNDVCSGFSTCSCNCETQIREGNRLDHPRLDDTTAKSRVYPEAWIRCIMYNTTHSHSHSRFSLSLVHLQRNESRSPTSKKQSRCLCYYRFRLSKFYTDPRPLETSTQSSIHIISKAEVSLDFCKLL